jgi:hypothetical protein
MKTKNRPKAVLLFLFIFLCSLFSVHGLVATFDEVIYSDDFEYSTTFTDNGYSFLANYGGAPTTPIDYSSVVFGFDSVFGDDDITLTAPDRLQIRKVNAWFDELITLSRTPIIEFYYYDENILGDTTETSVIHFPHGVSDNEDFFQIIFLNDTKKWEVENWVNTTAGSDCLSDPMSQEIGIAHQIVLFIDYPNEVYSLYVDGECTGTCCNQALGRPDSDAGADGIDIRFDAGSDGINKFIDDITIGYGSIDLTISPEIECPAWVVFCDDFNRDTTYLDFGWFPYNSQFVVDSSFTPIDNEMQLNGSESSRIMFHDIFRYEVTYPISTTATITGSPFVPVMSSEFELSILGFFNPVNLTKNCIKHEGRSGVGNVIYEMAFCKNGDIRVRDDLSDPDSFEVICPSCLNRLDGVTNNTYNIKISTYFNSSAHSEITAFSTNFKDKVVVSYACIDCNNNTVVIVDEIDFVDDRAFDSRNLQFKNEGNGIFAIDDYFVYSGLSKESDTVSQFFEPVFQANLENASRLTTESEDLSETVKNLWWTFGLRTQASKTMFGMFLIMGISVFLLAGGIAVTGILFFDIILLVLGVLSGLFPIWIFIVLALLAGGIAFFIFSKNLNDGG